MTAEITSGHDAYKSVRSRIEQWSKLACRDDEAVDRIIAADDVGAFSDAKSELIGGVYQALFAIDQLAEANPWQAYNVAVGFLFALRASAKLGSYLLPSDTSIRFAQVRQQEIATEAANEARANAPPSPQDEFINGKIAELISQWTSDGGRITATALHAEISVSLIKAGFASGVSKSTIERRLKKLRHDLRS